MIDKSLVKSPEQFNGINIHRSGDLSSYGVAMLPGKVRPSLFKKANNNFTPIASFSSVEHANEFVQFLERLVDDVRKGRIRTDDSMSDDVS